MFHPDSYPALSPEFPNTLLVQRPEASRHVHASARDHSFFVHDAQDDFSWHHCLSPCAVLPRRVLGV